MSIALVSIIICTCNRAEHLRQTLEAMHSVCVPGSMPAELIVVDNASTDDTAEIAKRFSLPLMPILYIHEPRRGKCYAQNTGIAAARGEIILFTDDDVRPPENWIKGMCEPILSSNADAVAGGVRLAPHLERPWMEKQHRAKLADTSLLSSSSPAMMVGANMAFSKKVLEKVPSFDPELGPGKLGFHDENIFSQQLRHEGFNLVAALDVVVEHHFEEDRLLRRGWLKDAERRGMSDAYVQHHIHHGRIPLPHLRLIAKKIQLAFLRLFLRHKISRNEEGIDLREGAMVQYIHYVRHYLVERRRPRNYEHGTYRRLVGTTEPPASQQEILPL